MPMATLGDGTKVHCLLKSEAMVLDDHVKVHRVLHKNTFQDFIFRSNLPFRAEDEELAQSKQFWRLIDEGRQARPSS